MNLFVICIIIIIILFIRNCQEKYNNLSLNIMNPTHNTQGISEISPLYSLSRPPYNLKWHRNGIPLMVDSKKRCVKL